MRIWKMADWVVLIFFGAVVALVFQQISTSMVEQNIASGGPYNNSASYPRAVAVLISIFLPLALLTTRWEKTGAEAITENLTRETLKRPLSVVIIFVVFLLALPVLGYHLAAPGMLMGVMFACGLRGLCQVLLPGLTIPLIFAYIFEVYLKIVLPGGWLGLNIVW